MSGAALSSLQVQMTLSRKMEIIADNLANMSTPGFKAEMLAIIPDSDGTAPSDKRFAVPLGIVRDTREGNLSQTGNALDLAIQGKGFFQVELPTGETAYTRDGTFQLDANGQIVTHEGYKVLPGITVSSDAIDITINASGQVLMKIEGQVSLSTAGQLQIASFPNDAGLEAIGGNLYTETPASGNGATAVPGSTGFGSILQGFLETSNVNAVEEISNLISAQRAYEMNSKVIQTADEMMGTLTSLR